VEGREDGDSRARKEVRRSLRANAFADTCRDIFRRVGGAR
jgi:hypothetical protein